MKDTHHELETSSQTEVHSQKYLDAVAKLELARRSREQTGYATMLVAATMAGGTHEKGKPGRVVRAARAICILFAFSAPSLLVIQHLL